MQAHKLKAIAVPIILVVYLMLVACIPEFDLFGSGTGELVAIDRVEVTTTDEQPPSYIADVDGYLPDTCSEIGETTQAIVQTTIKVTINVQRADGSDCTPESTPFTEEVPLDVEGLKAGSYAVDVNGTVTSFTLMEDH